jgi:hypothetical protein
LVKPFLLSSLQNRANVLLSNSIRLITKV